MTDKSKKVLVSLDYLDKLNKKRNKLVKRNKSFLNQGRKWDYDTNCIKLKMITYAIDEFKRCMRDKR